MAARVPRSSLKDHSAVSKILMALSALAIVCSLASPALAKGRPENFLNPERAVAALVAAARDNDTAELLKIYGPAAEPLIGSGDAVADREAHTRFADHYAEQNAILNDGADRATLVIGKEQWPFPIPLVRRGGTWHFDVGAGAEEILNRRIGRNELNAIEVCRSYTVAQRDYAADLPPGQPPEYAQRFVSSAGRHDGLYWPVQPGEKESPIGPQMASARMEGYVADPDRHAPYHGYFYKILTRQGRAAPGGARDYLVEGHMSGGFALVAFPAKYGDSGVMTFVVNQDGLVYEKDLGADTARLAPAIAAFDPDLGWRLP